MVYVDDTATIFQASSRWIAMTTTSERPDCKAAEVCEQKAIAHLIYGKFIYGNKRSSLVEFKRRTVFSRLLPKYYIPLTLRGELFVHAPEAWVARSFLPSFKL
ncbi:MAG: hypothetical protein Udaeo2_20630 [Candidatus Udaeobacter sp.]|nr:MAG: hypothetical protein Udaeo2_20630 [Candidatus Udaeobacter sp.]